MKYKLNFKTVAGKPVVELLTEGGVFLESRSVDMHDPTVLHLALQGLLGKYNIPEMEMHQMADQGIQVFSRRLAKRMERVTGLLERHPRPSGIILAR